MARMMQFPEVDVLGSFSQHLRTLDARITNIESEVNVLKSLMELPQVGDTWNVRLENGTAGHKRLVVHKPAIGFYIIETEFKYGKKGWSTMSVDRFVRLIHRPDLQLSQLVSVLGTRQCGLITAVKPNDMYVVNLFEPGKTTPVYREFIRNELELVSIT